MRAAPWRRRVSVPLLVLAVATLLFAAVAHSALHTHSFVNADLWLGLALQADPSPWVHAPMAFVSAVHGTLGLTLLSSVVVLVLWSLNDRPWAIVFATTMLGEALVNSGLKQIFMRPRPAFSAYAAELHSYSFPSGHSMAAAVFYGLLALWWCDRLPSWQARVGVWAVAAAMTGWVGFSRIYLGAHFASDVVAGFAAGAAWLALMLVLFNRADSARGSVR
jgi:undecaprenyl-diphosphatase